MALDAAAAGLLAVKLLGVGLIVLGATLLARRHGHRAGGLVAGLPLIAGTVTGLLLLTQPPAGIRAIAVATLACVPATVLHQVVFAAWARRHGPAACSAAANTAFALAAAVLGASITSASLALPMALCAVLLGGLWLGRRSALAPGSAVAGTAASTGEARSATADAAAAAASPRPDDLPWRVGAAVLLAALLLVAAEQAPPAVGGWLLALPIVGNVLPVFTLRRDGVAATQALLRGFVTGFGAFVGFFALLVVALPLLGAVPGAASGWATFAVFAGAVLGAPLVGAALAGVVRRAAPGGGMP